MPTNKQSPNPERHIYIKPNIHIHPTLAEAQQFLDTHGADYLVWSEEKTVEIPEIAQGHRTLVIGEPGVGKTVLLKELQKRFETEGIPSTLIDLRNRDSIAQIDQSIKQNTRTDFRLLLDGLDEVQGHLFPSFLENIENISVTLSHAAIYISSRSVFMKRYKASFPDYRVATISPFTRKQVKEYLSAAGYGGSEIDGLLRRMSSFSHSILVVQIPRYLEFLSDVLANRGIHSISRVSRNELFEYFIYKGLNTEEKRQGTGGLAAITKRLLEKIALTMEIYQTNTISRDELMTFMDELESDLKFVAMSQLEMQSLFDKALLKDNHDSIEFHNTEFQEYLAAKEITRFPDPKWTAFAFSVQPSIGEIHPSWFNALTFLVDMHPDLLGPLVEFSGLRGNKVIDEGFITFLSRIDPNRIRPGLKNVLFTDIFKYFHRVLQWIPVGFSSLLASIYDPSLESLLKSEIRDSEAEIDHRRYVPLGNTALIVGRLLEAEVQLDRPYWRNELLRLAADENDNGVLQRNALFALEKLNDPSVINDLPAKVTESHDELIFRSLLTLCTTVAPDNPRSMGYFFEATRRSEIDGRYGLYALTRQDALKTFLKEFNADDAFRRGFLDKVTVFKDDDRIIVEHIRAVCDEEIHELCKQAIVRSFHFNFAHDAERSAFLMGLGQLLKDKLPGFFSVIIDDIRAIGTSAGFFFTRSFFARLLDKEDIPYYLDAMTRAGEHMNAFAVMQTIKVSGKAGSDEIFEAGRPFLSVYYDQWEKEREAGDPHKVAYERQILDQFRALLEPEPKQFGLGVFAFYLDHSKELDPIISPENKTRLAELVTGSVLNNIDPGDYELKAATQEPGPVTSYTVSSNISLFGDALRVADYMKIDVSRFRQRIINYVPFAYSDHLRSIFNLVSYLRPAEMEPILAIYKDHKSDLWRHMPGNLIDTVERYRVFHSVPVLRTFVNERVFPAYVRERALVVVESLAPDKKHLEDLVALYQNSTDQADQAVCTTATNLLVTGHSNPAAIRRKLQTLVENASPFGQVKGVHAVGPLEEEIVGGRSFAKPLMQLKTRGFEQDYLRLLDSASELWAKGKEYYTYAQYLWDIVYAYFDNLKEHGSYEPLQTLEKKLNTIRDKDGSNWLLARMAQLRRSYLAFLGKPQNIAEAIRQYNQARHHDNKKILNSEDLQYHLKEVIDTELTRWIEAEGAYDLLLSGKIYRSKRQPFEKLVQKTL